MPLQFHLATASEHPRIESMVIDSFEPITWFKKLDARVGPLNGKDWRTRWQTRMRRVFESQIVLVGESGGELAAMSEARSIPTMHSRISICWRSTGAFRGRASAGRCCAA